MLIYNNFHPRGFNNVSLSRDPFPLRYGNMTLSPIKKRDKRKSTTLVELSSRDQQRDFLRKKLEFLRRGTDTLRIADNVSEPLQDEILQAGPVEPDVMSPVPDDGSNELDTDAAILKDGLKDGRPSTRKVLPIVDTAASTEALHDQWQKLLPSLRRPLLTYMTNSKARPRSVIDLGKLRSTCCAPDTCISRHVPIICLFYECKHSDQSLTVHECLFH